jgi:hypothetical protein
MCWDSPRTKKSVDSQRTFLCKKTEQPATKSHEIILAVKNNCKFNSTNLTMHRLMLKSVGTVRGQNPWTKKNVDTQRTSLCKKTEQPAEKSHEIIILLKITQPI